MDADRHLASARADESTARQTAEISQLRVTTTEQLLTAARETAAAQQARADQAVTHLEAARTEAREAIERAARSDATRQAAEQARNAALDELAAINRRLDPEGADEPPSVPRS